MSNLLQEATLRSSEPNSTYLPATPYTTGFNDGPRMRRTREPEFRRAPQPLENPLAEIVPDELYSVLRANDLINEKALRDFVIRRQFRQIKTERNMRTSDAILYLQSQYPYLQLDTIRKIVYRVYPTSNKKPMI